MPRGKLFVVALVLLLAPVAGASAAGAQEFEPQAVELTGTVRDFTRDHPDMQFRIAFDPGIVEPQLGEDRKPVYTTSRTSTSTTNGREFFDQWYRDVEGVNLGADLTITLQNSPAQPTVFTFDSSSFFPIDGQLFGNQGMSHNYYFTFEIHSQFTYRGGEVFSFRGDDDVFVFVNDRLVIDIGGVHGPISRSVNLDAVADQIGLEVGETYPLDFFFAERFCCGSNFRMQTSIVLEQPPEDPCGNGVLDTGEQCDDGNTADGDGCSATCELESLPPVALCQDPQLFTGFGTCSASASVDAGSFDPEGDLLTLAQSPTGPYGPGATAVTLQATDEAGASASCDATVNVVDREAPLVSCNAPALLEGGGAPLTFTATSADNCRPPAAVTVEVTDAACRNDDLDDDGVPDDVDDCPGSDLSDQLVIGECATGADNVLFVSGCTLSDLVLDCAEDASNHGDFVSCVSHLTNGWRRDGVITGRDKGRIESCAARSPIPPGSTGGSLVSGAGTVEENATGEPCAASASGDTVSFPDTPGIGLLSWTVTASDGFGNTVTEQCSVHLVNPDTPLPNLPPAADAGQGAAVLRNTVVELDGSGSADLDGDQLAFQWRLEAPAGSAAALSDPAAANPTFVTDLAGVYRAELVVSDGQAESAPDAVQIAALNSRPAAAAGPDATAFVGEAASFDGSASVDPDGDPLTFSWQLAFRPPGSSAELSATTGAATTLTGDLRGTYVAQLVVSDGGLMSPVDAVVLRVPNAPPVAAAGPDQEISVFDTVQLDGSGSSDLEGDPLTFQWTLLSVPAGSAAALSDPTAVDPTFEADLAGTYVAQLVVSDGPDASAPDTVEIVTINTPPVADAGPDQTAFLGDPVTLDGTGSSDVDGDELTFQWAVASQPAGSSAALSDPTSPTPTFVGDVRGVYVLELTVHDGLRASRQPDQVTVTVVNRPPVADAGADQTVFLGDVVQLDGTGSFDLDADALTFAWSFVSRPSGSSATLSDPTAATPTFPADARGSFVLRLVVNDGIDASAPDTVTVTVPNQAPVADAGADREAFVNDTVVLDGSASSDADGDPLTFSWSFDSRPAGSAAALDDPAAVQPSFVVDAPGTYVVSLVVDDGFEASAPDTVTVTTVNSPPVADAGPDQEVLAGDTVQLDGSASFDVDGDALTFAWSFVSVPPGSGASLSDPTAVSPTFVVDVVGAYLVELVVHDGIAASAPDTVSIATGNVAPVADAGSDQTAFVGDVVQLDGSGSFDANGDAITHAWSFVSVPDGSLAALSDPTAVNPTFEIDLFGTYTVQLVVNDGEFDSTPDPVTITTENSRPVADAGANQLVPPGTTIFLDGSGSSDADEDPLTFSWSLSSVPEGSTAALFDPTAVEPSFDADVVGTYVAQLIVNDGELDSLPDTVTIEASDDVTTVPDVVGLERTSAEAAIVAAGLTVGAVSTTSSDTVPADHVVSQAPPPGTLVFSDSAVLLVVSTGPAPNGPPTITSTPLLTATEGVTYFYPALATDAEGDPLTWSLILPPAGMTVDGNGLVQYTPLAGSAGDALVTLRVEDGTGNLDQQSFVLTIAEGGGGPSITSVPPLTAAPGTLYSYTPTVSDGDDLFFTWSGTGPAGLTVDAATGAVLWNVPAGASGSFEVRLTVADPTGLTDTQIFSIGVGGDAEAPTVSIAAPATGDDLAETVEVFGSVNDPALAGFTLEACRPRRSNDCTVITRGLTPVTNGVLGTLNPKTVSDGSWELRLTARDAAGNVAVDFVDVEIHTLGGKIGVVRLAFPELTVQTSTATLTLTRVYDGLDRSRAELGNGWRYDWSFGLMDMPDPMQTGWERRDVGGFVPSFSIVPTRDHPMTFTLEDGRFFEFDCSVSSPGTLSSLNECTPTCTERTGNGATLTVLDGAKDPYGTFLCAVEGDTLFDADRNLLEYEPSHYRLETSFGEQFTFSEQKGSVDLLRDVNGLTIDLRSASSVELNGVELIRFTRSGDLITRAENLVSGDVVTYTHDALGDLVEAVTITGDRQTFQYASGSRLISYQVEGQQPERWEYDDQGRVVRHHTSTGAVIDTEYDDAGRRITKRDLGGREIVTDYDALGRITAVTDPLGNTTTYTYVGDSQQEASVTDPLGNTTEYEYDAQNRRTLIRNGEGEETRFVYNDLLGRPTVATDGEGRVWEEVIDASGRVTAFVLPDGTTATTFTYPGNNTRVETDVFGSYTVRHDDRGRPVEEIDGLGRVTTTLYDDLNRRITFHEADGEVSVGTVDALDRFTTLDLGESGIFTYSYPPGGSTLPEVVVRPDGISQEIRRDSLGRTTHFTVDGQVVREVRYDALGQVTSIREAGEAQSYKYDAAGRLATVTNPNGTVELTHDAAGRLTELRDDAGRVTRYHYDAADRPVAVEDAVGRRWEMAYDDSGRPISVLDPLGRTTSTTYDANGRRAEVTDFNGLTLSLNYLPTEEEDGEASPASITDRVGLTWQYGYDPVGNVDRVTDPLGAVTSYEYTTQERLNRVVDALSRITTWSYGDSGAITSKTTPEGRTDEWHYDGFGRVSDWQRPDGSVVAYTYDGETITTVLPSGESHVDTRDLAGDIRTTSGTAVGTIIEQRNLHGDPRLLMLQDGARVEIEYTASGLMGRVVATSPAGSVFDTRYEYDSGGRLTALIAPDGGRTTFSYDAGNRLTRIERPNGVTTTISYLGLDRPTRIQHSSGGVVLQTHDFGYDARGRLSRRVGPDGTFEFEYDGLGRLRLERELGVGDIIYTYDAVGNLVQRTLPTDDIITCSYDGDDRLLSCNTPDGVETYAYNGRGALTQKATPSGITTYEYDDLDRLVRVTTPEGADIRYQYDVDGRLVGRDDGTGMRRCLPLPTTPRGFDDCALSYSTSGPEAVTAYSFGPEGISSVHTPSGTAHTLHGLLRTVTGITDARGDVLGEASYDAWGRPTSALPESLGGFGYTGERQDPASGLIYLRQRWYDPRTRRFLTPDSETADGSDPRSLHRYVYTLNNPVNNTDPSGGSSVAELAVVQDINNVLGEIKAVWFKCMQKELTSEIFEAVARWSLDKVSGLVWESATRALGSLGLRPFEADFEEKLLGFLCRDPVAVGNVEFQVRIRTCGEEWDRRGKNTGAYSDCSSGLTAGDLKGITGVDILLWRKLPLELKGPRADYDRKQLRTYCRFASEQRTHAALYLFWKLPGVRVNKDFAKQCWGCWGIDGCMGPGLGSVYGGIGVQGNRQRKRIYVPDSKTICGKK